MLGKELCSRGSLLRFWAYVAMVAGIASPLILWRCGLFAADRHHLASLFGLLLVLELVLCSVAVFLWSRTVIRRSQASNAADVGGVRTRMRQMLTASCIACVGQLVALGVLIVVQHLVLQQLHEDGYPVGVARSILMNAGLVVLCAATLPLLASFFWQLDLMVDKDRCTRPCPGPVEPGACDGPGTSGGPE